jgi:hypothetical protein
MQSFEETIYKESMKAFSTIIDKITRDTQHFSFEPDGLTYPNETFEAGLQLLLATKRVFSCIQVSLPEMRQLYEMLFLRSR